MKDFIEYIEKSCARLPDTHIAYLFKKHILDEMTDRANEMTHAGLRDEKVLADLMADEYPDLPAQFKVWSKQYKKQKLAKTLRIVMGIGGVLFFIAMFIAYFAVSRATGEWGKTWLIIVGGIFAMIIFYTSFIIKRICRKRRVFHPIARFLLAVCVMMFSVFMFLYVLVMYDFSATWPIVVAGIILMLLADLVFAFATKQKFRTISAFVYMPIISTMAYIILAGCKIIDWFSGGPIILLGFVADLIGIICIAVGNARYFMYKKEDDE